MFKPVQMKYLRAMVLSRDEKVVLKALGRVGLMQLSSSGKEQSPMPPVDNGEEIALCDGGIRRRICL